MTQCLFAHGFQAYTAELVVRYRRRVAAEGRVAVRAWLVASRRVLHELRAELLQDREVKATARAKLIEFHE